MGQRQRGLAAIFLTEDSVLKAANKSREMGLTKFEAISPYPIHGMEEACGIKRSPIPYVTFIAGCIGGCTGLWLTWWTSAVDWPINVGGKPLFSLPAFIPIIFELTVLFGALASVAALGYYCSLGQVDPPIIDPDLTSHKFAIFVPDSDTGYDVGKLESMFKTLGAAEVKKVSEW